jgi:hypothetical protein
LPGGETGTLFLETNIRTEQPLPGGDWTCEFAFRTTRTAVAFRSGGPVGRIVDTTVCPKSNLITAYGEKVCVSDHAATPLPLSEPVYCSALFTQAKGHSAQIQVLHADGSPVWVWNFDVTWPTYDLGWAWTSAIKTSGDYLCRFKLDDGTTVDKPFRVGPG